MMCRINAAWAGPMLAWCGLPHLIRNQNLDSGEAFGFELKRSLVSPAVMGPGLTRVNGNLLRRLKALVCLEPSCSSCHRWRLTPYATVSLPPPPQ